MKTKNWFKPEEIASAIQRARENKIDHIIICEHNNLFKMIPINNETAIVSISSLNIKEIFALGKITKDFDYSPTAKKIKQTLEEHFKTGNSVIIILNDNSAYRYDLSSLGKIEEIEAIHNTIVFPTNKYFYTKNIKIIGKQQEIPQE